MPPEENTGATAPQQSFTERKAAQLSEERAGREQVNVRPDPEPTYTRSPEPEPESAEALDDPNIEAGEQEEEEFEEEQGEPGHDDDDELPPAAEEESEEPRAEDWEKRYKDTARKLSEVTENRREMEREQTEIMSATLGLRHSLEDKFTEAQRYAESFKNNFDNQIGQLEQAFNSGMIEPDKLPQARQHYQALVNQRNALAQQVEQIGAQVAEATKLERERKAEIARVRLNRTIPGWSREKHRELGEYAAERGYTPEEFSENLDYRFFELLNDSMQLKKAASTVTSVRRKRKAGAPNRNAVAAPRSADGRFKKAKADFESNPNQRGRFAEMKYQQMQKEHRR